MKAARFYGTQDLRIEDAPEPSAGPGQVKLRNAYAGICGSDLHFYFAPESLPFDVNKPHPLTGVSLPQILGHEFSGTVVEVGEGVVGVKVGDRGPVFPMEVSCGTCLACRRGLRFSCAKMGSLGASSSSGGLAEYSVGLRRLAAACRSRRGGPSARRPGGAHGRRLACRRAQRREAGRVGAHRRRGTCRTRSLVRAPGTRVDRILVSEPSADRRASLRTLGASVLDPMTEHLPAAVAALTDGNGT